MNKHELPDEHDSTATGIKKLLCTVLSECVQEERPSHLLSKYGLQMKQNDLPDSTEKGTETLCLRLEVKPGAALVRL